MPEKLALTNGWNFRGCYSCNY